MVYKRNIAVTLTDSPERVGGVGDGVALVVLVLAVLFTTAVLLHDGFQFPLLLPEFLSQHPLLPHLTVHLVVRGNYREEVTSYQHQHH